MVTVEQIGTYNGTPVNEFTISNLDVTIKVMEYGATLHNLYFGGVDCVAGYDGLEGYINGGSYQGSTVGRYANRIAGASFEINGKRFNVDKNEGENSLHGGSCGFSHRMFKGEKVRGDAVRFTIHSPDGEGGYPGALDLSVTYTVEYNTVRINYDAVSDKDTVMNFTNHSYFNLGAPDNRTTLLTVKADAITPVDEQLIPYGRISAVEGTPFDFRTPKPIGADLESDDEQMRRGGGYDHNFVLGLDRFYKRDAVTAYCPESGITMTCSTDLPGVQIYTSNALDEPCGKNGRPLTRYYAFCLETQLWPDTPNHPSFPSCFVKAGQRFRSVTEYRFSR